MSIVLLNYPPMKEEIIKYRLPSLCVCIQRHISNPNISLRVGHVYILFPYIAM